MGFRKGRPRSTFKTEPRTFAFFSEDVVECQKYGYSPKEVFRLGMMAKRGNPQLITRVRDTETENESIQKKLARYVTKFRELEEKMEDIKNARTNN